MLRTIAVWNKKLYIVIPLAIISAGQWGFLLHGVTTVKATWDPISNSCQVAQVNSLYLNLVFLWTMFTDLIVLILTLVGLLMTPGRSQLWRLLLGDGILYFVIAFVANTIPAVFLLLNLSPVMNVMFPIPCVALTTSVACRSFVRLSEFAAPVDRTNTSQPWSAANTRVTGRSRGDIGKTSTIQWARPQTETVNGLGGINVTRSQHVEADIGLESYSSPRNIHPLSNTSDDMIDRKGGFAMTGEGAMPVGSLAGITYQARTLEATNASSPSAETPSPVPLTKVVLSLMQPVQHIHILSRFSSSSTLRAPSPLPSFIVCSDDNRGILQNFLSV
ncbi:hypothetical protein FRC17_002154 [Serendipita sp. 399]|nr:hypothetical protein FRC17_002154 [Serendipita sp. 399]